MILECAKVYFFLNCFIHKITEYAHMLVFSFVEKRLLKLMPIKISETEKI